MIHNVIHFLNKGINFVIVYGLLKGKKNGSRVKVEHAFLTSDIGEINLLEQK